MSDGRIVIEIDADGKPIRTLNKDLGKLDKQYDGAFQDKQGRWRKANGQFMTMKEKADMLGKSVNSMGDEAQKGLGKFESPSKRVITSLKDIVIGLGLVKVASAAFGVLKNSLDDAITRFDTMNKYPKAMSALGFSTDDSSKSVKRLADGIDGLPTRLDTVVSTAQRMTAITGNMNKSTDATIALNNAMLASGASTEDASRGMEQYIQMLSTGKVDMQSWRSLQETMPIGLQKTAEAMGYVGKTAQNDLYAALKSGKVTFDEFQNKLIELGTGTGELAKLAKLNSEGIGTSFENLKSSVIKGLANVMQAIDDVSKAATGKTIAQNLDSTKAIVNAAFESMTNAIRKTTPFFQAFGKVIGDLVKALGPYSPAIRGFVEAITAMLIVKKVAKAFNESKIATDVYAVAVKSAEIATKLFTLATSASARQQLAKTVVEKASAAATAISTAALLAKSTAIGILTGTTSLATVAMTAFKVALDVLLGPIGWVTAAVGLLVAGGVALWKQLHKESDAVKELNSSQEELLTSTEQLADDTERNIQNRQDEIKSIETSKKSYQTLITELERLAEKESKTTAEKNKMKSMVEELNNSIEGLNLSYDAQNDALSQTPSKIMEQVAAFNELDKAREAQQQLNDIIEERNTIESKLSEINEQREKWNSVMAQSPIEAKKAGDAINELNEKEATLKETQAALQTDFQNTSQIHQDAINNAAVAVESGVFRQQTSYNALNETQKEVMDSMRAEYQSLQEKATNAFDQISIKTAISTEEMIANMQKNQETIANWANNIAILADRGVNQGLLEQLRNMGPEGAAYTAELVNSSDEQLQRLNEVYGNGGTTAMNALSQSLQLGKQGVNDEVSTIIPEAEATLQQKVAAADFGSVGRDMTDSVRAEIDSTKHQVAEATGNMANDAVNKAKETASTGKLKEVGIQIPNGMKEGINAGKKDVEKASGDMAKGISTKAKDQLGVHSPSRVFKEIGSNVIQGLKNGIDSQVNLPQQAISSTIRGMISSTNNLTSSMSMVGRNAMVGLANGINANAGYAYNAARHVANQVAATIRSALSIHSPSRVMRDEVGKFIPQGIAVGIEADSKKAYKAMSDLATGLIISPETALGAGGMNLSSAGGRIIQNTYNSKQTNINRVYELHTTVELNGREVGRSVAVYSEKELNRRNTIKNVLAGET
ncbi:tape measure protein [Enterococcus sp. AZ163]|uniref:tape measure protein n=1 Tax=Enterococcus sp. AZ163 TaxID=2774638 RepID=UPI003D2A6BF5